MKFETWWDQFGQRKQCFTAIDWARAGWGGHKYHHNPWEELQVENLLLDKPNELCDDLPAPPEKAGAA